MPAAGDPPVMPEGLSPEEQACWTRLLEELASVPGLACRADRGICELVARLEPAMRKAAEVLRDEGSTLACYDAAGRMKFVQTRPEAAFVIKVAASLKSAYAELGLTPSGRARLDVTPAPPASKLDQFLQTRHGA